MNAAVILLIVQWVAAETTHIWRLLLAPVSFPEPFSRRALVGVAQKNWLARCE